MQLTARLGFCAVLRPNTNEQPMITETQQPLPTLAAIREVIRNRPRSMKIQDIAEHAQVSKSWIHQVLRGDIVEPGYEKVQVIVNFVLARS